MRAQGTRPRSLEQEKAGKVFDTTQTEIQVPSKRSHMLPTAQSRNLWRPGQRGHSSRGEAQHMTTASLFTWTWSSLIPIFPLPMSSRVKLCLRIQRQGFRIHRLSWVPTTSVSILNIPPPPVYTITLCSATKLTHRMQAD